jgi:hypothetical protein
LEDDKSVSQYDYSQAASVASKLGAKDTESFPPFRVFPDISDSCRNGAGPEKLKGVMKIISDTTRKERVVAKQGKINTHRQEKKQLSV